MKKLIILFVLLGSAPVIAADIVGCGEWETEITPMGSGGDPCLDLTSISFETIPRQPSYAFDPKPDITCYELSEIFRSYLDNSIDSIKDKPTIMRHMREYE